MAYNREISDGLPPLVYSPTPSPTNSNIFPVQFIQGPVGSRVSELGARSWVMMQVPDLVPAPYFYGAPSLFPRFVQGAQGGAVPDLASVDQDSSFDASSTVEMFKCPHPRCDFTGVRGRQNAIQAHFSRVHTSQPITLQNNRIGCYDCEENFEDTKSWWNHYSEKHNPTFVYCSVCQLTHSFRAENRHQEAHAGNQKILVCYYCQEWNGLSVKGAITHINSCHTYGDRNSESVTRKKLEYIDRNNTSWFVRLDEESEASRITPQAQKQYIDS